MINFHKDWPLFPLQIPCMYLHTYSYLESHQVRGNRGGLRRFGGGYVVYRTVCNVIHIVHKYLGERARWKMLCSPPTIHLMCEMLELLATGREASEGLRLIWPIGGGGVNRRSMLLVNSITSFHSPLWKYIIIYTESPRISRIVQ